jgi:ABC-2 type transport system ATP-binding protein
MIGQLSGLRRSAARQRAAALLERLELSDAADRQTKGYSGGMRRRLDLAASMMMTPPVLFLDEPTTGLDPAGRLGIWEVIRGMVGDGCTVLLTTQYLDEADHLADQIAVFDHGRVIASGTPQQLKSETGSARLEVTLSAPRPEAVLALQPLLEGEAHVSHDGRRLRAAVLNREGIATAAVRALDRAGILVDDVQVHQPSLDDVFLALTGRETAEDEAANEPEAATA